MPWLQPLPDALLASPTPIPRRAAASGRAPGWRWSRPCSTCSARQRAVLILRDVLEWPAAEVAPAGDHHHRGQQRAAPRPRPARAGPARRGRRRRARRAGPPCAARPFRDGVRERRLTALTDLLREDVALEMPPLPTWFTGREAVRGPDLPAARRTGAVPDGAAPANGQPAFAVYERDGGGVHRRTRCWCAVTASRDGADRDLPGPGPARGVRAAAGVRPGRATRRRLRLASRTWHGGRVGPR